VPQPLKITNNAVRRIVRRILGFIPIPSCDFASKPLTSPGLYPT
jgi:hypothetical protein